MDVYWPGVFWCLAVIVMLFGLYLWKMWDLRKEAEDPEVQAMYRALMEKVARQKQHEEDLLQAQREAEIAKARRGELNDDEEPRF